MLDQNFSHKNIEKIYQYARRNGKFSDTDFPENLQKRLRGLTAEIQRLIQDEIKPLIIEIRKAKKDEKWEQKDVLEKQLRKLNENKKYLYSEKTDLISDFIIQKISFENFQFTLKKTKQVFGGTLKDVYKVNKIEDDFVMNHIQRIFRKIYKVQPANRYLVTSQIKSLLTSKLKFCVLKTDIKNFYETINTNKLIDVIDSDNLLSADIKRILKSLLEEYKKMSKSDVGIPRGIGISASLAEFYLRRFDSSIKNTDGVLFYVRYVDDIIIFSSKDNVKGVKLKDFVQGELTKENLDINNDPTKTKFIGIEQNINFEYLGYRFEREIKKVKGEGKVAFSKVDMSLKRYEKYKKQIEWIFDDYKKYTQYGVYRDSNTLLLKRIRYITSNTRIKKKGERIHIGIFYNNSLITEIGTLKMLDSFLRESIETSEISLKMKEKLKRYSFKKGFTQRCFFSLVRNKDYKYELTNKKKMRDINTIINLKNGS